MYSIAHLHMCTVHVSREGMGIFLLYLGVVVVFYM